MEGEQSQHSNTNKNDSLTDTKGVGWTSLLVASFRANETNKTEEEGRLFSDPQACIFWDAEKELGGEKFMDTFMGTLSPAAQKMILGSVALRVKLIDTVLLEALSRGIEQIVILASGLDSRAYRLRIPSHIKLFEVDFPHVVNWKENILQKHSCLPTCSRTTVRVDLSKPDWPTHLIKAGFDPKARTFYLIEGLSMYLEEEELRILLQSIQTITAPKSEILLHVFGRLYLESEGLAKFREFLDTVLKAPWKFAHNNPLDIVSNYGWDKNTGKNLTADVMLKDDTKRRLGENKKTNNIFVHAYFSEK